jgi:hypothetical protein
MKSTICEVISYGGSTYSVYAGKKIGQCGGLVIQGASIYQVATTLREVPKLLSIFQQFRRHISLC